ncbi:MAG: hypothetical protein R3C61_09265 [Bacteroidia bacterium]
MNPADQFFRYKPAANLLWLIFALEWISPFFTSRFPVSSMMTGIYTLGLLRAVIWIYVWMSFRRMLHEHFRYVGADVFFWIIIPVSLMFSLLGLTGIYQMMPEITTKISGMVYSGILILFALKIYAMEGDLFGLKRHWVYSFLAALVYALVVYQLLSLQRFPGAILVVRGIHFFLSLFYTLFFYQILIRAHRKPAESDTVHEETLIEEIGDKIEEV